MLLFVHLDPAGLRLAAAHGGLRIIAEHRLQDIVELVQRGEMSSVKPQWIMCLESAALAKKKLDKRSRGV